MIYIRNLPWNIQSYYFNETKTDLGWWNLSSYEILSSRPDNFSQRTKDCHQLNRYMLLNLDQYLESRSFWFFFFWKKLVMVSVQIWWIEELEKKLYKTSSTGWWDIQDGGIHIIRGTFRKCCFIFTFQENYKRPWEHNDLWLW